MTAIFEKVSQDITSLKPKMKQAKSLSEVPLSFGTKNLTLQVKADGEFNYIQYNREAQSFMLNRFGRKTTGLQALTELTEAMSKWNIVKAEMLAECYAVGEDGSMLTLPNLIHYLKGSDKKLQRHIKLGVFDLVSLNGSRCTLLPHLKFDMMEGWFEDCKLVNVLSWLADPTDFMAVEKYWQDQVEKAKWEGLIIRVNGDTWKVKPNSDVDVAIIGVNKNNKGFAEGKAKSLKMGLLNDEGNWVEIGDCAGFGEDEASELFELVRNFKIGEDSTTVFVQPVVIMTVEYIQTFPDTKNKVYRIEGSRIREVGEQTLVRLRNPHVKGYRSDKQARLEDVGLNQVESA